MDIAPILAPMMREALLHWAERQEILEFDGVDPVPMSGRAVWHHGIAARIITAAHGRLGLDAAEDLSAAAGVATPGDRVCFPDPVRIDHDSKGREDAGVPSTPRFVIVEQDSIDAAVMARTDGNAPWTLTPLTREERLHRPKIHLERSLDGFYRGLEIPA